MKADEMRAEDMKADEMKTEEMKTEDLKLEVPQEQVQSQELARFFILLFETDPILTRPRSSWANEEAPKITL